MCREGGCASGAALVLRFFAACACGAGSVEGPAPKPGRLCTLALLGRRIWSKGLRNGCFPLGRCESIRPKFSTLLLNFIFMILSDWPKVDVPAARGFVGLRIVDASLPGLPTRGMPYPASLRNSISEMDQAPERQRSTKRCVVGVTSRIRELLTIDSSATRICGRLYGVSFS